MSLGRVPRATALGLLMMVPRSAAADTESAFRFHAPPGWVDLSRGAPDANLSQVLPSMRARAEVRRHDQDAIYFATPTNAEAVITANILSTADSEPMDDEALEHARALIQRKNAFVVDEGHIEVVNDLKWGRFTGAVGADPSIRAVMYVIPGRPRSALLLFASSANGFDAFLPAFEAAARQTEGAQEPKAKSSAPVGSEFLLLGLIGAGAFGWIRLRKKKQAPPAAPEQR